MADVQYPPQRDPRFSLPLDTDTWDPDHSSEISQENRRILTDRASVIRSDIISLSKDTRFNSFGLIVPTAYSAEKLANWMSSPGSPVYYLDAAAGYIQAAVDGNVCYSDVPKSIYRQCPPNSWCCDHNPRHCR